MTLLALELGSLHPEIPIQIIKQTLKDIETKLYTVIFLTPEFLSQLDSPAKRTGHFEQLQELVSALYVCTATETDYPCDVIFADWCGYSLQEEMWEYSVLSIPASTPDMVTRLPRSSLSVRTVTYLSDPRAIDTDVMPPSPGKTHAVVAVGGTFDHLHAGHKILLSMTAFIASRKLICGITGLPHHNISLIIDDALLKNKKFADLLESISFRTQTVRTFLTLIARNLELDLVPIQDVYGPTAYDPDISALVISEETRAGAGSIADLRWEKGLQPLEVFVIDVIGDQEGKLPVDKIAEVKMSSTKIRERLSRKEKCHSN